MLGRKLLAPHHSIRAVLELLRDSIIIGVYGCEAFKALAEAWREGFERLDARADQGITTGSCRGLEHADESGARRLLLRRLVGVPLDRTAAAPGFAHAEIVAVVVDDHVLC